MFLTLVVWIYMYVRRIAFITGNELTPEQMATPGELARLSPPEVSNPSDNLKNLFEVPVLFYALALYLFTTSQVDATHVTAAWIFVGFRATAYGSRSRARSGPSSTAIAPAVGRPAAPPSERTPMFARSIGTWCRVAT